MKTICPIALCAFLSLLPIGCSVAYRYNSATGKYETKYISGGLWGIFTDSVDHDIGRELHGEALGISWTEHWIERCESLHYDPSLGERYIQYIIDARRAAGLPGIPEIEKRQFRSKWQIFADNVDKQLGREREGLAPPALPEVNNWPGYWKLIKKNALRNPDLAENGSGYIEERRSQTGLAPLN